MLWHSPESNFTANAQTDILHTEVENYTYKINCISPRGQHVNLWPWKFQSNLEFNKNILIYVNTVNPSLVELPLKFNGGLAERGFTSSVN